MKLDLQGVLRKLDRRSLRVYDDVRDDPEARGELEKNAAWMIPQWMSAAQDDKTHEKLILDFDEVCNPGWRTFYRHPELQMKLLALIGAGSTRHKFYRPTGGRIPALARLAELLRMSYPDLKSSEVLLWCREAEEQDLEDLMDAQGIPLDERKNIRAEFEKGKRECQN